VFRNKQVTLKLEKSPKDPMDVLDEPMPIEEKVQIVKDFVLFGAGLYTFKVVVDTCATLVINAAWKGIK
jgi:hypothetical protein